MKKLINQFSIYFFSNIVNKAIPFLLLPIISRYLEPEDFGKLALFSAVLIFLAPFVNLSLISFVTVEFFQKSKEYIGRLNFQILFISFFNSFLIGFVLLIARYIFGDFLSLPLKYYFLLSFLTFFANVTTLNLCILRNIGKATTFGVFQISSTILNLLISILLVVSFNYDWEGRAYAIIVTSCVFCLVALYYLYQTGYLSFQFSFDLIKPGLLFSTPLIPSVLFISFINYIDRFFIKEIKGEEELGLYAIGFSFGMIVSFIIISFEQVFIPWIYKLISDKDKLEASKLDLVRFTYIYCVIVITLAILVTIGSHLLLHFNFLPQKYSSAKQYILWISLSYSIWGICNILSPYIAITKQTNYILISTLIGCVVNMLGNYFLIDLYGTIGAAYSKVFTFTTILVGYLYFSNKIFPLPWLNRKAFHFSIKDFLNALNKA